VLLDQVQGGSAKTISNVALLRSKNLKTSLLVAAIGKSYSSSLLDKFHTPKSPSTDVIGELPLDANS
jgi:hypothetical protein